MGLKFLVCLFLIFLSISISISKPESPVTSSNQVQVQENHAQQSLIHGVGHVGMEAHSKKKMSSHTRDVQVQNGDGDQVNFMTYMKKSAHGAGGGLSSSIHHSRRNRASSLSTHSSSFFYPCIVVFGLILLSII